MFLLKAVKLDKYKININCFTPQNEPHTSIQYLPVGLKYFRRNLLKTFFLLKKMDLSERSSEIVEKFVYLNKFEKGQIQRKIWISCEQPYFTKQ